MTDLKEAAEALWDEMVSQRKCSETWPIDIMERALAKVRAETVEECAAICEMRSFAEQDAGSLRAAAKRIRALAAPSSLTDATNTYAAAPPNPERRNSERGERLERAVEACRIALTDYVPYPFKEDAINLGTRAMIALAQDAFRALAAIDAAPSRQQGDEGKER